MLSEERKKAGLSQKDLAKKTGISISTIRKYEQGRRDIDGASIRNVYVIADVLKTEVYNVVSPELKKFILRKEK